MKTLALTFSAALIATSSLAFAGGTDGSCGCYTPPPVTGKVKANSGVGNGSEVYSGTNDESADVDPGNSGPNNSAGKNVAKPNSPRAGTVNIIP